MTGNSSHQRRATSDERSFFEALVAMRARYVARDADDATSTIGVHHAIAAANAALANAQPASPLRLGFSGN